MKSEITFRAYQSSDSVEIERIIAQAWHYNDMASPKTASKLAKVFLSSCLANQTYTRTAVKDDKPIGIIMAKSIADYHCPLKYRLKQIFAILSLLLSAEGRSVSKIFSGVSNIDKQLVAANGHSYQGEVAFFAVSDTARGKGIGAELFNQMLDYMKSTDVRDFFLFTDTSCNYGFYDHIGMTKRGEKSHTFFVKNQQAEMTFFLYDYRFI